jgi:hypothetical protein
LPVLAQSESIEIRGEGAGLMITRIGKPCSEAEATSAADVERRDIPALFATIHVRSEHRPAGFTEEEIAELNEWANRSPAKG